MDIVVTIPKSEYKNDEQEMQDYLYYGDLYLIWSLHVIPKNIKTGDRVYFVKNNKIIRSMRVIKIEKDHEFTCQTTGRRWNGKCNLVLDDYRKESINKQIQGFQGFRYFNTVME